MNTIGKRNWIVYGVMVWLAVLHVYLSFTAPIDPITFERYPELTSVGVQWLRVTIVVPVLLVWFALLYGTESVGRYARAVEHSTQARAWKQIAWGLGVFIMSLIFSSAVAAVQVRVATPAAEHVLAQQVFQWINLYSALIFSLDAFSLLYSGSKSLLEDIKGFLTLRWRVGAVLLAAVVMVGFSWVVFTNEYRLVSEDPNIVPVYGMPDALIVLTILIPYTVAWLLGLLAAGNFLMYRRRVRGVLYKDAFGKFAFGVTAVLVLQVFTQLIGQFQKNWAEAGLKEILILVYVLISLMLVGYLVMAWGARKLIAIESAGYSKN